MISGGWESLSFAAKPGTKLTIDLVAQAVTMPGGGVERFDIDPFRKECLLAGIDEIQLTSRYEDAIAAYERRQREETPWLSPRRGEDR